MKEHHDWPPYDPRDDDYPPGWQEHERREQRRANRIAILWIVSACAGVVTVAGCLGFVAGVNW